MTTNQIPLEGEIKEMPRMKTVAIVEARMNSKRLPNKALVQIGSRSAIHHCLSRLDSIGGIDQVIVATTIESVDDELVSELEILGADYFRGSEMNVLDRVTNAALNFEADFIFKIGADCPFPDVELASEVIQIAKKCNFDFVSNTILRTFPDGYDVGVVKLDALILANREANTALEREHTSLFIRNRPDKFNLGNIVYKGVPFPKKLAVTLDTPADLEFLRSLNSHLQNKSNFGLREVVALVNSNPNLVEPLKPIQRKGDT